MGLAVCRDKSRAPRLQAGEDLFQFVGSQHGLRIPLAEAICLHPAGADGLGTALDSVFRARGPGVLFGALPFVPQSSGQLELNFARERDLYAHSLSALRTRDADTDGLATIESCTETPGRAEFCQLIDSALSAIASGAYEKIVLSRMLDVSLDAPISPGAVLERLSNSHASGHVFALRRREAARETWLLGATPELLLSRRGRIVRSTPLAGSMPRSPDPEQDRRRAAQLLDSEKDLREHAYVVDSITRRLEQHCPDLWVPARPSLVATPTMWHLGSEIVGTLASPGCSSLELALALHPTPAVCGYPSAVARDAIADLEPHQRGAFCGMVGWTDDHGDGEWAVTIRCAEIEGSRARLYAGVGIVAGSAPELELRETDAKLATMMAALAIDPRTRSLGGTLQ